jgi:hypothetical protein
MAVCRKCNGTGVLPAYRHIEGGRCFSCDGTNRTGGTGVVGNLTPAEQVTFKVTCSCGHTTEVATFADQAERIGQFVASGRCEACVEASYEASYKDRG